MWSTIYAYDDKTIGDKKPTTIADFFDTKTWTGKRGLRKTPKANLEMALLADGVPAADIYQVLGTPEGVDRAFKKLDTLKSNAVWWEAGAQPPQLLADGEVQMTTAYNGRIFNAIASENKPFKIVWDGQIFDLDLFVIPKGTKKKDLALKFIAFCDRHPASGRPGGMDLLWSRAQVLGPAHRQARGSRHRHEAAHADRA